MDRDYVKNLMESKGIPYWAVYFGITMEEINSLCYDTDMTKPERTKDDVPALTKRSQSGKIDE